MSERPVVALIKWTARRRDVDALTGVVTDDPLSMGLSAMDEAALEWALRMGNAWRVPVVAISAGGPSSDEGLRLAVSCGAACGIRIDMPAGVDGVARALATELSALDPLMITAGVHGLDRASGSVPARVAHHLDDAQALGLVDIGIGEVGTVRAVRRIDGGGREHLEATAPTVLSVEGATASLRRAGLTAVLAAKSSPIRVITPLRAATTEPTLVGVARRYRPRTQIVAAPVGAGALGRIMVLTDAATPRTPARTVELDADDAAMAILAQLADWGIDGARGESSDDAGS